MTARQMRVLVACEFSGTVRDAFRRRGHHAISCDLEASEKPGPHYQGSVLDLLGKRWDLLIAHPPCTHLAASGARWFAEKVGEQIEALDFFRALYEAPVRRIAIENPVSVASTFVKKPTQTIQPWQFGHGEVKTTCLWLRNLPWLEPTNVVEGREERILMMSAGKDRRKERSRTYSGVAEAMAEQWG